MKVTEKTEAIRLRQLGLSYGAIASKLKVSESTLSLWLRDIELTADQIAKLKTRSGINSALKRRAFWNKEIKEAYDGYAPPLNDPMFTLGLGLYWGEGSKWSRSEVALSNSDPKLCRTYLKWMRDYFGHERFSILVHHYHPKNDYEVRLFWSEQLGIPLEDFRKSQFAVSKVSQRKKQTLPHGTAHIRPLGKGIWKTKAKINKALNSIGPAV